MNEDNQRLKFKKLPGYAAFILENHLEEYTRMQLRFSIEEEVPLLRLFSHLSEEELFNLSLKPTEDFLKVLIENRSEEFIAQSIQMYVEDRMPEVGREEILAKDITIGTFVRRKSFRKLLIKYTQDYELGSEIMEEIDRFIAASDGETFKAYIQVQQERITSINQELTQGREELLELQELADMGSFVWNLVDGTSKFTPSVSKILGELDGTEDFMSHVHPDDLGRVKQDVEKAMQDDGIFESEYRYIHDGQEKNIWSRGVVTFENGVPVSMKGNVMDVTDKSRLIAELKENEALSKQSQALTHIGNWSWELGTDLVTWSDEMYRIYGLEPQSEQITFERFLSLIHPDYREKRLQEIQESLQSLEAKDYTLKIVNPDGTEKVLRGKGEVLSVNGKATGLVGTCQDVTKEYNLNQELRRKTIELEKLNHSLASKNSELERINKELESFNYVASHDLQEPLRKIQVFTGRILEKGKEELTEETSIYFDKIIASSSRMRRLIDDLLKFSRTSSTENKLEPVDLNTVVEEVMHGFTQGSEDKNLTVHLDPLPVIEGIDFQLQQLFSNLFSNSVKYARHNTVPKVTIRSVRVPEADMPANLNASGDYHRIDFEDNGIGFASENAEKIFDLFQRLHGKEEYSGTGIGLAICKKIVYNHNGFITASSILGEGAVFSIYFPVPGVKKQIPGGQQKSTKNESENELVME